MPENLRKEVSINCRKSREEERGREREEEGKKIAGDRNEVLRKNQEKGR